MFPSAAASCLTYTFMPPDLPCPGAARGQAWKVTNAARFTLNFLLPPFDKGSFVVRQGVPCMAQDLVKSRNNLVLAL